MKISVTEEDIARGRRGSPLSCPVALAVRRTVSYCTVGTQYISLLQPNVGTIHTYLPDFVIAKIDQFDHEGTMLPFEFELDTEGTPTNV